MWENGNSRSRRINPSSSTDLLLSSPLASVNSSDSFTSTILNSNILLISSAVLASPGHVLIVHWRVRLILSLLGQISVHHIVETQLRHSERRVPSWKMNSHRTWLVCINSDKALCFSAVWGHLRSQHCPSSVYVRVFAVQGIFYTNTWGRDNPSQPTPNQIESVLNGQEQKSISNQLGAKHFET